MFKKLTSGVLDLVAPIVEMIVAQSIKLAFNQFYENDPESAELTAVSLYPIVDTKLEPLAEKTDTELDDAGVKGLMSGIENFAEENGIELPNLDDD